MLHHGLFLTLTLGEQMDKERRTWAQQRKKKKRMSEDERLEREEEETREWVKMRVLRPHYL